MVETGRGPASGVVAGTTTGAKAALVDIFRRMAGIAVSGWTKENMGDMTILADNFDVLAIQFEDGQIVVEGGRCPAVWGVAGPTIGA